MQHALKPGRLAHKRPSIAAVTTAAPLVSLWGEISVFQRMDLNPIRVDLSQTTGKLHAPQPGAPRGPDEVLPGAGARACEHGAGYMPASLIQLSAWAGLYEQPSKKPELQNSMTRADVGVVLFDGTGEQGWLCLSPERNLGSFKSD